MKITFVSIILLSSLTGNAQLHSGTPVIHSKPQPVPNSSTAEKSAPPQPIIIPPPAKPVPPIYPGADTKPVIPRPLINPPTTPSGTQPVQKEPLSPVESTNTLQPNRPPRDRASRENNSTIVSPVLSNRSVGTSNDIYYINKSTTTAKTTPSGNNKTKSTKVKSSPTKMVLTKKKPR